MRKIKRKSNPEYEYVYFIFRPLVTVGGDEDIEVLSSYHLEDEYDREDDVKVTKAVYKFARDFERHWAEETFESAAEALAFLEMLRKKKVKEHGYSHREKHIVDPSLVTSLYLNQTEYNGIETLEVVAGERVDFNHNNSMYLKFVAYIGYHTVKISDD